MKRAFVVAIATAGIGLIAGAVFGLRSPAMPVTGRTAAPQWSEIPWPFAVDEWGTGKAYLCSPADCGARIAVYLRPKVGFCNCSTGVSDDGELERVADTALVTQAPHALSSGRAVKVAWMHGLSRPYRASGGGSAGLLSIAYNDDCDAVVALATTGTADPAVVEPMVLALLNSMPVVLWTKKELGLEFVRRDW